MTTFHTDDPVFLARQENLFSHRQKTGRPAEKNYEWTTNEGTLLSLFKKNAFHQGGWWELIDDENVIKSCGAYVYQTSLVVGVRYYCFSKETKYRFGFLNRLLPEMYKQAQELQSESIIMTFNEYNKIFFRVFNMALQSEEVSSQSKEILKQFSPEGPVIFNHVRQLLLTCKISPKRQWYESF